MKFIPFLLATAGVLVLSALAKADDKVYPDPLPPNIDVFKVKTTSKDNPVVPFYLRIPKGYDATKKDGIHRILLICPVFNGDGRGAVLTHSLLQLADDRRWFVLAPTFTQKTGEVRDRKKSYYYPESFSGKAVLDALEQVKQKYPVDTERLLLMGLSGGAQFVHRFALWAPERVTAVAVNSSSWFDEANSKSSLMAWLVTIGESDPSYNNTLEFVDQLRVQKGAPVFRSYLGMIHEGDPRVTKLDAEFLTFYDEQTKGELGKKRSLFGLQATPESLKAEKMPFVGDSQNWQYVPNTEDNREGIAEDARIFLPSEAIAKLWGKTEED